MAAEEEARRAAEEVRGREGGGASGSLASGSACTEDMLVLIFGVTGGGPAQG